jgi:type II secretion system protein C
MGRCSCSSSNEAAARGWSDRQIILERNLFQASLLQPEVAEASSEELEETKLPLELLGTAVTEPGTLSVAAIMDKQQRRHQVVRVGDQLDGSVRVVRIEHRRVVLRNGARLEELVLVEDEAAELATSKAAVTPIAKSRARARSRTPRRPSARRPRDAADNLGERVRRLADDRFAVPRSDVRAAATDPAGLFSQARILPKYEEGEMVGLQLNAIKADSLFQRIGIQNGDTVTELNGIRVTSPEESATLLQELSNASEFTVLVRGSDGQERTLVYELEEDEAP